jgi:hypothetical protein
MVHMRAEFVGPFGRTDAICRQLNHVYASSCVFKMFKKIEVTAACEMRSVIRYLNARNTFIVNFVRCMENMPLVIQWYGDG